MAKKVEDVTKEPQALTNEDVNAQDSKTRLWQSLSTTYGQRTEDSNKAYDQSIAAADRAAQQRGMGRSSYNLQTMANLGQEKATAADRINRELIADYQNRLGDLEAQERQEAFQREQFEFQKERANIGDQQWQQQFDYGKERDTVGDTQWQQQFGYQQERDKVGDTQWQKSFDQSNKQWQAQFDYGKDRDKVSDEQWQKSFDYQDKSNQQQIAIQYLNSMLQNGGTPSDDLLKQAGISREDYNQMKKKSGGGGYSKKPTTTGDDDGKGGDKNGDTDTSLRDELDQFSTDGYIDAGALDRGFSDVQKQNYYYDDHTKKVINQNKNIKNVAPNKIKG